MPLEVDASLPLPQHVPGQPHSRDRLVCDGAGADPGSGYWPSGTSRAPIAM